ncbi:cation diffusion facilitator family transporter [soil metagenome]
MYAALAGNLLVAATKTGAAFWTGSASMLSEAVHSLVDTTNELLLLYGMRRSQRGIDSDHPVGSGRELYFWSFVVALLIFALGAGVSLWQGVEHIRAPEEIHDPHVSYIVLALAFVFEGYSWWVSLRAFRANKGDMGFFEAFRRSKDPPSFMVLFEDSAALIGIVIAAAGTYASASLNMPIMDGVASVTIGLVLAGTSLLLLRESKSLLIGERADDALAASIVRIAQQDKSVLRANGLRTVQLSPDQVLAMLSLEFEDALCVPQIEQAVAEIERKVRQAHPEVLSIYIKLQTPGTFEDARRREREDAGE